MKGRALVVADDPPLLALLEYNLRKDGYEVDAAPDAEAAALLARANPPALLVVDTDLPGFGLMALCRALRARPELRTPPILALLGRAEDPVSLGRLGFVAARYLGKPFTLAEFAAAAQGCEAAAPCLTRS